MYPEKFSAAIVMAGMPPENAAEIEWQIPILILHSQHDELMPIEQTRQVVEQLSHQGVDIELRPLKGITHFEVHRYAKPLQETIPWLERIWGTN